MAATLNVTEPLEAGDYDVVKKGTDPIPPTGDCQCNVQIGTVTTLEPGTPATAAMRKEGDTHYLDLGLTKGDKGDKGDDGEDGQDGQDGGSSGNVSLGRGYIDVTKYAKGDGTTDDAPNFERAWNEIRGTGGKMVVPVPSNFYNFKSTFRAVAESSQVWVDIECYNTLYNKIRWTGPSNEIAIEILGLKSANWKGLHLISENGRQNVCLIDVSTSEGATSSTNVKFENFRLYLGDGIDNGGVRTGLGNGGNGDISHYNFVSCSVYGGGGLRGSGSGPIRGQYGFQNLGHNTLANTWENCFVDRCENIYTNISRDGQRRGNTAVSFYGCGGAHNGNDFVTSWEGPVNLFGGRYENGHGKHFIVRPEGKYKNITMIGTIVKDYDTKVDPANYNSAPDGSIIDIRDACSMQIYNCIMTNGRSNTKFTKPIKLSGADRFGFLDVRGGGFLSDAQKVYTIENNNTQWDIGVKGVARLGNNKEEGNIYSVGFFPNE